VHVVSVAQGIRIEPKNQPGQSLEPTLTYGGSELVKNTAGAAHLIATPINADQRMNGSSFGAIGKNYGQGKCCEFNEKNILASENNIIRKDGLHWIIDSGAMDHMIHSKIDIRSVINPIKTGIINANGDTYPVKRMGHAPISKKLILNNTLLVPSLSEKLISVGRIIEDLNCAVLMYPDFCIFFRISKQRRLLSVVLNVEDCITSTTQLWEMHTQLGAI
jgi:hypothetical protein